MADDKQIEILMEGVETWKKWPDENRGTRLDLTKADLRDARLDGADLHRANLREGGSHSRIPPRRERLWSRPYRGQS